MNQILQQEKEQLRKELYLQFNQCGTLTDEQMEDMIEEKVLAFYKGRYVSVAKRQQLKKELFNGFRKLDVLSGLLENDEISEIMVNGGQHIFVEQQGRLYQVPEQFASEERLRNVIQQIVSSCNRMVNETVPIVDARLKDGSRVNVVLPPVALDGAVMTIRKFPKEFFTMEKLIGLGSITQDAALFLEKLVKARYNIFISGGTGSGKTTFLNVLSNYIPAEERVITIEDSAELQINNVANLVRLETRNANVEGENEITMSDLIKAALRMRPDRIIVGEVRDHAAMDMANSMLTGHDGSISTGHGNSAQEMMIRLVTMILMGYDMPVLAIKQQLAAAIDIVVHLGRLRDNSRRVLEISEVEGVTDGEIRLRPIYRFYDTSGGKGKVTGSLQREQNLLHTAKLLMSGIWEESLNDQKKL